MVRLFRPKPQRPAARLRLEVLEGRALPSSALPDIAVLSARLDSSTVVRFDYRVTGNPGAFKVGLYRSADAVFDARDVRVGALVTMTAPAGGAGSGQFALVGELATDPGRKHVLVVADPEGRIRESNETNNLASFRKLVLGGVTHGFTLTGTPPPWMAQAASALTAKGYDHVIRFDWTALSQQPVPNGAVTAGQTLAGQVRQAAAALATRPNDVVDVHLIGHSRGTGVISYAFRSLELSPGVAALRPGYFRQTLLDPHVARNQGTLAAGLRELAAGTGVSTVGQFSYNPASPAARTLVAGTLSFQAGAQDPPAFVPGNVDRPEVFFQRLAWNQTAPGSVERVIGVNFWSDPPSSLAKPPGKTVEAVDVGRYQVGHYGVPDWWLANALPRL